MSWVCVSGSDNTAPLTAEWKGTGTPLLMTFGRRGQVQFVDFFDNRKGNYNVAVAATSGAGKSFFTNELVVATRSTGGRVSLIDAGKRRRSGKPKAYLADRGLSMLDVHPTPAKGGIRCAAPALHPTHM
jgi:Mrp family chromosome partitioning ATPase